MFFIQHNIHWSEANNFEVKDLGYLSTICEVQLKGNVQDWQGGLEQICNGDVEMNWIEWIYV